MANKFHKYDDLLDESGSYRAAAEKALIRSFYGYEKDLLDYLYSKFYSSSSEISDESSCNTSADRPSPYPGLFNT